MCIRDRVKFGPHVAIIPIETTIDFGPVVNGVFVDHHQAYIGAGQNLPLQRYNRKILTRQAVLRGSLYIEYPHPPVLVEFSAQPCSVQNLSLIHI